MYNVLALFNDGVNGGIYHAGDTFPRDGVTPTKERIDYLLSSKNKLGRPVIELIKEVKPKNGKKEDDNESAEE